MLVGHDYAVHTDLSALGVSSPGEPKAGELILISAIAGYTGRSSRCSGSITRVARHPAAESYVRRCPQSISFRPICFRSLRQRDSIALEFQLEGRLLGRAKGEEEGL